MTKEKLELAVKKNKEIAEKERTIQTLKNSDLFYIYCFDGSHKSGSIHIPLEIVDFAINNFINEKIKLEKEFAKL